MAYSNQVKARAKKLRREGISIKEIAEQCGASNSTVSKWTKQSVKYQARRQEPTVEAFTRSPSWLDELHTILAVNISENLKKAAIRELVSG